MKIHQKQSKNINILYRLSFSKGMLATKIITVILSAFAFLLFAIGSMGFTYSYPDYLTRGYMNYMKERPFIEFVPISGRGFISIQDVKRIEEVTGLRYVYNDEAFFWGYFIGDKATGGKDLFDAYQPDGFAGSMALSGSAEDYRAMGYELLAGKYPSEPNEIAISEAHYESFVNRGYYNAAKNFEWKVINDEIGHYVYNYELEAALETVPIPIKSYQDIIGKTFGMGDISTDAHAVEYTIVGVVDTHFNMELAEKTGYPDNPSGRLLRSSDWKEKQTEVSRIFAFAGNDSSTVKKCVKLSLENKEKAQETNADYPVLKDLSEICPLTIAYGLTDVDILALIFSGAGIFFGIFAALLNGHLTTVSLEQKQKNIGILRSMGASERTVRKIFLIESLITATVIFLLALISSIATYYGLICNIFVYKSFGISPFVYNGWTVLILAAMCYAVPLLCTIVPLKKFFKKPITDNISGNTMKKRKR